MSELKPVKNGEISGNEIQNASLPEELLLHSALLFEEEECDEQPQGGIIPENQNKSPKNSEDVQNDPFNLENHAFALEVDDEGREIYYQKVKKEITEYLNKRQGHSDILREKIRANTKAISKVSLKEKLGSFSQLSRKCKTYGRPQSGLAVKEEKIKALPPRTESRQTLKLIKPKQNPQDIFRNEHKFAFRQDAAGGMFSETERIYKSENNAEHHKKEDSFSTLSSAFSMGRQNLPATKHGRKAGKKTNKPSSKTGMKMKLIFDKHLMKI